MRTNGLKNYTILFLCLISCLLAVGLYIFDSPKKDDNYPSIQTENIKSLGNRKNEFIYVYGEDCQACKIFRPTLRKAVESTNASIYKIDYSNTKNMKFLQKNNIYSTPTILRIHKGQILNRYEGTRDYSETKKIFQNKDTDK